MALSNKEVEEIGGRDDYMTGVAEVPPLTEGVKHGVALLLLSLARVKHDAQVRQVIHGQSAERNVQQQAVWVEVAIGVSTLGFTRPSLYTAAKDLR